MNREIEQMPGNRCVHVDTDPRFCIDDRRITVGEGPRAKWVEELVLTDQGEGKPPIL